MNKFPPLIYLSAADVRRVLPMPEAIRAMKDAFVQLSTGRGTMPPRGRVAPPGVNSLMLTMPCHSAEQQCISLKCVTMAYDNPPRGLPLIHALVVLIDAETGATLAIMDGAEITALRTGAAAGAATDLLARPEAAHVALIGSGVQARTQLQAICAVRPIKQARVYDVQAESVERFAREMSRQLGIPVERANVPTEALADADVVCTATTAREPVFDDSALRPGTHINAIGAYKPEFAEIPAETVRRARVVVDQVKAALEEAGDLLRPLSAGLIQREHFAVELGEVLAGRRPGRRRPEEITLFKSVGLAIQDLYAGMVALKNARKLGLGIELPR